MIRGADLIAKFQTAIDENWGYIMYMTHEKWSESKQAQYNRERASDPDCAISIQYGSKWYGHWVTDCSGLFKWAFTQLGGTIAHGSNSIWNKYCSSQGNLNNGKRIDGKDLKPGTAVFTTSGTKHNHIGLYIGGGKVIEAQGTEAGVIYSSITNKKWKAWGELKGVSLEEEKGGDDPMTAKVVLPAGSTGTTVNVRSKASKSAGIEFKVKVGSVVDVLEDLGTWCFIQYNGKSGYMMSNYLEYDGQGDESGDDDIPDEVAEEIASLLDDIEKEVREIRALIARG